MIFCKMISGCDEINKDSGRLRVDDSMYYSHQMINGLNRPMSTAILPRAVDGRAYMSHQIKKVATGLYRINSL